MSSHDSGFFIAVHDLGLPLKALRIDNSFKVLLSFGTFSKVSSFFLSLSLSDFLTKLSMYISH